MKLTELLHAAESPELQAVIQELCVRNPHIAGRDYADNIDANDIVAKILKPRQRKRWKHRRPAAGMAGSWSEWRSKILQREYRY